MMRTLYRKQSIVKQQGKSLTGWLFTLLIAGLLIQIVVKLSPSYLQSYYISDILKRFANDHAVSDMSTADIREQLTQRFSINNINSVATSALKLHRVDDKVLIHMNYEERIRFFANIDVVLSFQHHLDSSQPEQCCQPQ